ncbi:prohead protease [Salicola phage SCTP-2]|nr:prohead protease [Salicola phage SCTP-2]
MQNQVLREHLGYTQAGLSLNESYDNNGNKDLHLEGLFIQGDVENHNGRVYPSSQIRTAVDDVKDRISKGYSVLGEADHPDDLTVNLDRVSHMIVDMWLNQSDGYGKLKILPTPMGQIISTLLENKAKLGVSSRGSGTLSNTGKVSEYEIITVDIVANPSAPDAYPKPIYESLMNMHGGEQMKNLARESLVESRARRELANNIKKFIGELNKK